MLQDLRHGLRSLARVPGFAALVVITLALGIGANTAMFTVVDHVLIQQLPLPQPESLVRIQEQHQRPANLTGATFNDLQQRSQSFSAIAAYRIFSRNLSDVRQNSFPLQVDTAYVTPSFFAVAATRPVLGNTFAPDAYRPEAPAEVIISDHLWRSLFHADAFILNQTVLLHGKKAIVAGVMPPEFSFPESVEAWAPLTTDAPFLQNRRAHLYRTIGRLKAGISPEQANAELQSLGASIASETHNTDPGLNLRGENLRRSIVGDARPALLILLAAVAFVLLIACANAANLLLSRAVSHQKDVAIRTALGASRFRIIRQLLSETLLLSVAGGVLGSLIGIWSVRTIAAAFPAAVPRLQTPSLDWRVLGFAVLVSLTCVVLAGLFPALQVSATDPVAAMNATGRSTESHSRRRFRSVLLLAEVAVSLVLLTGAGLLIRSFVQLQHVDPGYDSANVIVAPISLPGATYDGFDKRLQFVDSALRNISSVPGVRSVAAAGALPTRPVAATDFELAGKPLDPANEPSAQVVTVTPDFLRTMGIRLLAGRSFNEHDTLNAPTVVLISQAMVNKYYGGENPIGRMITMKDWGDPLPAQIIGVVADVHQLSVEAEPQPAVYFSFAQFTQGTLVTYIVAKTDASPQTLFSTVRQRIWDVDAHQPVELATMEQVFADSLIRRRFTLALLAAFAALALVLTVVGVYGVISYSVSQRSQEFGIRIAVGARPWHVQSLILSQGLRTTLIGVAAGIVASLALTRAMRSLLFQISPSDPFTLVSATLLIVCLSAVASFIPARRATKVDPMEVLRNS